MHGVRKGALDSLPDRGPPDRRFRPAHRLRRKADFAQVFAEGVRMQARGVTILARPNGTPHPRLGLAIARRVVRRAVARHQLKRQIRESFRHHTERLGGFDVVVFVRLGVEEMGSKQFRVLLDQQWHRVRRLIQRPPASQQAGDRGNQRSRERK